MIEAIVVSLAAAGIIVGILGQLTGDADTLEGMARAGMSRTGDL